MIRRPAIYSSLTLLLTLIVATVHSASGDDVPRPKPKARISIGDQINGLALGPDEKHLAVATGSSARDARPGGAQVWELVTRTKVATVAGHLDGVVLSVAFSPDGSTLAVGDEGGGLVLWDVNKEGIRASADVDWREGPPPRGNSHCRVEGLTFGQDGASVAFLPSIAGRVRVHSATDGREARYWKTTDGLSVVALSVDRGKVFALAGLEANPLVAPGLDRTHRWTVWDVTDGRVRSTLFLDETPGTLALSPDGGTLAYLAADEKPGTPKGRSVTIRDAAGKGMPITYTCADETTCLAFSPSGSVLAVGSGARITLLDAGTGRPLAELADAGRGASNLAFDPEGQALASAFDATVCVWDVDTFKPGFEGRAAEPGPR